MTRNPLPWTASIAVLVLTAAAWMVATEAAGALAKLSLALHNVATAAWSANQAAQHFDEAISGKHGVKQVLYNVDLTTAQIGRTSNVIRLAASEERQALKETSAETKATIIELRGKIGAVLDGASATEDELRKTVADVHPQILGLVAASKVTAGEAATTMREIRRAVPGFITQGQQIAENVRLTSLQFIETGKQSAEASKQTAKMMGNLAAATKPLPAWLRIPLAITGAVAPTAAGILTGAAATGAFK